MFDQYSSLLNSPNLLPFDNSQLELECLTALSYRSGDLGAYLRDIALGVSRLIQSDWTIITLCEGDAGQIVASNIELESEDSGFSLHGTLANEVVEAGRSLIIPDSCQDLRQGQLSNQYLGYLGVPLVTTTQQVIGTICSFLHEPRPFTETETAIVIAFAARAAIAIENYRLYHQQQQFNERLTQAVATYSTDLKLSQEKLIEHQQLAAIGEFTTMIVHEIRNPLTTVEMGLRYAQKVLHSRLDQERLNLALSESHRLKRLLNEILCYAKPQLLQLSRTNISGFLGDVLTQIQELSEAAERTINYEKGLAEVELMIDIDKLKQVFLNLFRNALEAIAPQETVRCWISHDTRLERVCIRIHNGGKPIPPELLPQLTTPFCSTKPSGTGLGLAISKRIIVAHGGELEIESSHLGTTVSVYLPMIGSDGGNDQNFV